jgi:ubiquinone/menaquinone biosynthesis C-methylase UbiE
LFFIRENGPTFLEMVHQALCSTQRGYDLLAPKFDASAFCTSDEMLKPAIRVIGQVNSALDVCCGTGAGMRLLRPLCRHKVVGIDFSSGMLQQARLKLEKTQGTAKVEFVKADVLQMTFHEDFDVATCFGALGHILPSDQSKFLQLIHRALKPGGRFVLYTDYPPPPLSLESVVYRSFDTVMKVRNALLKPPFIMYYLSFLMPRVAEKLKSVGFKVDIRTNFYREHGLVIATKAMDA